MAFIYSRIIANFVVKPNTNLFYEDATHRL